MWKLTGDKHTVHGYKKVKYRIFIGMINQSY